MVRRLRPPRHGEVPDFHSMGGKRETEPGRNEPSSSRAPDATPRHAGRWCAGDEATRGSNASTRHGELRVGYRMVVESETGSPCTCSSHCVASFGHGKPLGESRVSHNSRTQLCLCNKSSALTRPPTRTKNRVRHSWTAQFDPQQPRQTIRPSCRVVSHRAGGPQVFVSTLPCTTTTPRPAPALDVVVQGEESRRPAGRPPRNQCNQPRHAAQCNPG
jgi:hypothetical protein